MSEKNTLLSAVGNSHKIAHTPAMHIILAYVQSLDGYLTDTKGRSSHLWASRADQKHFKRLVRDCGTVVFGSGTYESIRATLRPSRAVLRVVMTSKPQKYRKQTLPGMLEFSSLSAKDLVANLKKRRHPKILLAGGPRLFKSFFSANLISELQITTEPLLFGGGTASGSGIPKAIKLRLIDSKPLNQRGTLLARYKVL